jgi:hypothetical protein
MAGLATVGSQRKLLECRPIGILIESHILENSSLSSRHDLALVGRPCVPVNLCFSSAGDVSSLPLP